MRTAGLVLAAGAGRRMGGPKALLRLDPAGPTLLEQALAVLREGGCAPVVAVVGAAANRVRAVAAAADAVVEATDWQTGMGASLRAGLAATGDLPVDAVVVALVDQPGVSAQAVARLRAAGEAGAEAAVATYGGHQRNPVLLSRGTWPAVAALATGDSGARAWLRSEPARVVAVPCDDCGWPDDLDTPDDLLHLPSRPQESA